MFEQLRIKMTEQQIARRGITDTLVLVAMAKIPRHLFVPARLQDFAYDDRPLEIGEGQTISQPYMVAMMAEALQLSGGERVLEIGTGSGYAAAVLGEIAGKVFTIERHRDLADHARTVLDQLGYQNVTVIHGDGTKGWPDGAPYDAITAAAAGEDVPEILLEQLKTGGRLVIPVGETAFTQRLYRMTKTGAGSVEKEVLADVRFVPMVEGLPKQGQHDK